MTNPTLRFIHTIGLGGFLLIFMPWGIHAANAQPLSGCWDAQTEYVSPPGSEGAVIHVGPDIATDPAFDYLITVTTSDDGPDRAEQGQDHESVSIELIGPDGLMHKTRPTVDLLNDPGLVISQETFGPYAGGFTTIAAVHAIDEPGQYDSVTLSSVCWQAELVDEPALEIVPPSTVPIVVPPTTTIEVHEPEGLQPNPPSTSALPPETTIKPPSAGVPIPSTTAAPAPRSDMQPPELAVTGVEHVLLGGIGVVLVAIGALLRAGGRDLDGEVTR